MALSSYIILLAICLVTIFANHIHANEKNKHELFFDDLKDVYQQGKSYTGLLYKEGKMNVKVTNLKIFEVEANLDEPKKGGETLTGTDLTAKLTFSFDELLLENTIIDAPFIKKENLIIVLLANAMKVAYILNLHFHTTLKQENFLMIVNKVY